MAPSITSSPKAGHNPEDRTPRFININGSSKTGSKMLDTAWSFPIFRDAVDTLRDAHEKQVCGKGWIPQGVYQIGLNAANSGINSGYKLAETTIETTKDISNKVPTVIQSGIDTALNKAMSGVEIVDELGSSGLEKLRDNLPIVGDETATVKEKAFKQTQKLNEDLQELVAASWIGQQGLGALDATLTVTEKPLAFIGNVEVTAVTKCETNGSTTDVDNGVEKKVFQFRVDSQTDNYSMDVYTYGLHGKLIESARYLLQKVRHTRRNLRVTQNKGRKVLANKQRARVVPKKQSASPSLSQAGTVGYVAGVFQVDQLLTFFGLRIIPADRLKARQVLYPHMKLVPKCAPNPQENAVQVSRETIRAKRNRQSESDGDENQSYDEEYWIKQIDDIYSCESDADPDDKSSDTSLDSLESFEYASASEETPPPPPPSSDKSPQDPHRSEHEEHAREENHEGYHGDS